VAIGSTKRSNCLKKDSLFDRTYSNPLEKIVEHMFWMSEINCDSGFNDLPFSGTDSDVKSIEHILGEIQPE
jgi:hypothetical protein